MPSPSGTKIVSNFSNYAKHNMANNGWANSKGREYFTTPSSPYCQCWKTRINSKKAIRQRRAESREREAETKPDKDERQVTTAGKEVKKQS